MLIAISCPHCRHRGVIAKHKLPRSFKCSRCGERNRFERESALRGPVVSKQRQLEERRLSLYGQAQLPDDLLDELLATAKREAG